MPCRVGFIQTAFNLHVHTTALTPPILAGEKRRRQNKYHPSLAPYADRCAVPPNGGDGLRRLETHTYRGYSKVSTRTARRKVLLNLPYGPRTVCVLNLSSPCSHKKTAQHCLKHTHSTKPSLAPSPPFPLSPTGRPQDQIPVRIRVLCTGTAYHPTALPTVGPCALPVPAFVPGSGRVSHTAGSQDHVAGRR